jgi:hypothetical protein
MIHMIAATRAAVPASSSARIRIVMTDDKAVQTR